LRDARDLSGRLRDARFARGAARIDSHEVEFTFAEGRVVDAVAAAEHEAPAPDAVALLSARLTELEVPTPALPDLHTPAQAAAHAARISERVTRYVAGAGCGRWSGRATTPATSATRAWPAPRTVTSPPPSVATPTWWCTARCWA